MDTTMTEQQQRDKQRFMQAREQWVRWYDIKYADHCNDEVQKLDADGEEMIKANDLNLSLDEVLRSTQKIMRSQFQEEYTPDVRTFHNETFGLARVFKQLGGASVKDFELEVVSEKDNFEITLERHEGMLVAFDNEAKMKVARTFGFDYFVYHILRND